MFSLRNKIPIFLIFVAIPIAIYNCKALDHHPIVWVALGDHYCVTYSIVECRISFLVGRPGTGNKLPPLTRVELSSD